MTFPDSVFASLVPGTRRISRSVFFIVRQTVTAVAVESGLVASDANPSFKAVRYRRASLVAGSACCSPCSAKRKSLSVVVTMFSISELACASSSGMVLINIA